MTEAQEPKLHWTQFEPEEVVDLSLDDHPEIVAPRNENGERCPWPWEPQQLKHAPMGQYRCRYCGAMVMAGLPHLDYSPDERTLTEENQDEVINWLTSTHPGNITRVTFALPGPDAEEGSPLKVSGIEVLQPVSPDWLQIKFGQVIHRDGFGILSVHTPGEQTWTLDSGAVLDEVALVLMKAGAVVEGSLNFAGGQPNFNLIFSFAPHREHHHANKGDTVVRAADGTFSVRSGPKTSG